MTGQITDLVAAGNRIRQSKQAQQQAARDLAATLAETRRPPAPPPASAQPGAERQP